MNHHTCKELARAVKALKQARRLRKAADKVLRELPTLITLTTASGRSVTLTLRAEVADCLELALSASEAIAKEAHARELAAREKVVDWAQEIGFAA